MTKHVTVYRISAGDELNVFSSQLIACIKIMDMGGNLLIGIDSVNGTKKMIDIRHLPGATYIVEVLFDDHRIGRSVFVKM